MGSNAVTTLQPLVAGITIMGSGRLGPTLTALLGLAGVALGGLALTRARRHAGPRSDDRSPGRGGGWAALVLGAVSVVFGGLFLLAADGGPGTGNGVVASVAAIVLGPIAVVLGLLARTRGRQVLGGVG